MMNDKQGKYETIAKDTCQIEFEEAEIMLKEIEG